MPDESLLIWHPGCGETPRVRPTVESLKLNDLGLPGEGLGAFHAFGSLIDWFAGDDPELRRQFRRDFSKYLMDGDHPSRLHPRAEPVEAPFIDFPSYRVPWEWAHDEFMEWFRTHRGGDDFMEPAGRRWNDFRGNLGCHWVGSASAVSEAELKANNGVAGSFDADAIRWVCDNRFNPYRWVGPINEIQHHEQASLCCTVPTRAGVYENGPDLLNGSVRLEYELELELEDLRPLTGEETVFDFYGAGELTEPIGVVSQTHWNAQRLIRGETLHDEEFSYGQKRFVSQWLQKRCIQPNLQVSLMVNFRERGGRYRLAEFMLAEFNQQPIFFFDRDVPADVDAGRSFNPFRLDGNGVLPTANEAMNRHVVDGGCSGNFAWTRTPVDVFRDSAFAPDEPIVHEGGDCLHWDGKGPCRAVLSGVLDVGAFYRQARNLDYFPGQRGYWGSRWVGFEGDASEFRNPAERHGLEWLGLIFENHGPFRLQIKAARLNLCA